MTDRPPESDPVQRLSELLRDKAALLVERWERRVLDDRRISAAQRSRRPRCASRARARRPDAARLGRGSGSAEQDAAEPCGSAQEDPPTPHDLRAALGEITHLRAALIELCAAEGVRLEGEAALLVHAVLDEAMTCIASAIEHVARAAEQRERERST